MQRNLAFQNEIDKAGLSVQRSRAKQTLSLALRSVFSKFAIQSEANSKISKGNLGRKEMSKIWQEKSAKDSPGMIEMLTKVSARMYALDLLKV